MTIIDKIKTSVEGATGLPFLYHAAGEINELVSRANSLPISFAFLLDSGTIEDVNGRYHERVTLAVMFTDKTEFDFNALENEEIIDRMKVKAYKWLDSLRNSNDLQIVSVNSTQRLYDTTTDILTGYAVNITLQDIQGVGECELPEVVIPITDNGIYNVVGVDKVSVNVVPRLEELEVTQNGEYLPPIDIAGFSKISVEVQPVLEELFITKDGEYLPSDYDADGFSKVTAEFDTSSLPKVKVSAFSVNNDCINEDGIWEGERLIDTSECTDLGDKFNGITKIKSLNASGWDTRKVGNVRHTFSNCPNLKTINLTGWDLSSLGSGVYVMQQTFASPNLEEIIGLEDIAFNPSQILWMGGTFMNSKIESADLSKWGIAITNAEQMFFTTPRLRYVNLINIDFSQCGSIAYMFSQSAIEIIDITNIDFGNVSTTLNMFFFCSKLRTLIGGLDVDYVISNNVCAFKGLKVNITIGGIYYADNLDRASLRALINGLADLTGQTAQTLTLGATLMAKLTEEDIAIAVNKNWTIV